MKTGQSSSLRGTSLPKLRGGGAELSGVGMLEGRGERVSHVRDSSLRDASLHLRLGRGEGRLGREEGGGGQEKRARGCLLGGGKGRRGRALKGRQLCWGTYTAGGRMRRGRG